MKKYNITSLNNQYFFYTTEEIKCPICSSICMKQIELANKYDDEHFLFSCNNCSDFQISHYTEVLPEIDLNYKKYYTDYQFSMDGVRIYDNNEIISDINEIEFSLYDLEIFIKYLDLLIFYN